MTSKAKKTPAASAFDVSPAHAADDLLWRLGLRPRGKLTLHPDNDDDSGPLERVAAWAVGAFRMTKAEQGAFLLSLGLREQHTPQGATKIVPAGPK